MAFANASLPAMIRGRFRSTLCGPARVDDDSEAGNKPFDVRKSCGLSLKNSSCSYRG